MVSELLELAQTTQSTGRRGGGGNTMWIGLILMIVVFYFFIIRGNQKQKKQRQAMLSAVQKGNRVVTAGGIIGTVVAIRDNEITLKVDETTNTKMTFLRSAIQNVLTEPDKSV